MIDSRATRKTTVSKKQGANGRASLAYRRPVKSRRVGGPMTVALCAAVGIALLFPSGGALASPTVPCQWCCQGYCGGGGGTIPIIVTFYAFNGSGYASVAGTTIYNDQVKTISIGAGSTLMCTVNPAGSGLGYHFAGWYSTTLPLVSSTSCSTTVSSLPPGVGSDTLTLIVNRTSDVGWAGYSINSSTNFNEVSTIFTVPGTSYNSGYSGSLEQVAEWVGFGAADYSWTSSHPSPGFYSSAVWQAGVTEWYSGSTDPCGTGNYTFMWFQPYPGPVRYVTPTWTSTYLDLDRSVGLLTGRL